MSLARFGPPSLRLDRLESSRLAWALAISIALHLLAWCTYEGGRKLEVWERVRLPAWAKTVTKILDKVLKKEKPARLIDHEPPLVFVDVSPQQTTAEVPKNTIYYSDRNSQAANLEAEKDTGVPKIDGKQIQVVRTEDVLQTKAVPLQPAPLLQLVEPVEESKPKPALTPGDLTVGKPEANPNKDDGQGREARPRTIQEAKARQQRYGGLAGEKMKQDGGVKRRAQLASLDVRATPFGAYDAALIAAVQNRWYYLLDNRSHGWAPGRVVLEFRLNYKGEISGMKVVENTVDELLCLLCQKAIMDPMPFEKWPSDMRRKMDKDYRELRFAFYYN